MLLRSVGKMQTTHQTELHQILQEEWESVVDILLLFQVVQWVLQVQQLLLCKIKQPRHICNKITTSLKIVNLVVLQLLMVEQPHLWAACLLHQVLIPNMVIHFLQVINHLPMALPHHKITTEGLLLAFKECQDKQMEDNTAKDQ
jgi:hypothetical protein